MLPVFESVPLFQFEEEVNDKESKHAPLFQSRAVRCTLAAIDRADRAEALEGHERLAVLQNLLVDLLAYLECEEGFRVSVGARRKARLRGAHTRAARRQATTATILHQTRGRLRLGVPRLKTDEVYANRLQSLLESVEHVKSIRIRTCLASVTISYSPDIPDAQFAKRVVKTIEEGFYAAPVR